jgi:6-phosphofructokinase
MIKVAVITSGGDGSGINAAIAMLARDEQIDLYGFHNSFDGIMREEPIHLTQKYCENRSLDGKQLVKTARSQLLYKEADRKKIHNKIKEYGFEYLVICGGDGSKQAAKLMNSEGTKTLFVPMTIDNDICGSEYSIGFDTALNNIISIIHDLHDTAHNMPGRIFMVEVLGGNCGNLALNSAVAAGCDIAIVPEFSTDKHKIARLVNSKLRKKNSIIIICSESAYEEKDYKVGEQGVSFEIAQYIEKETNIRVRKTVMGFYMRSGTATFKDAMMASSMGELARECIHKNKSGVMLGVIDGKVKAITIDTPANLETKKLDADLVNIAIKNEIIIQ